MGNWLKGRLLIIPDQAPGGASSGNTATTASSSSHNNTITTTITTNQYGEQVVAVASNAPPPHYYNYYLHHAQQQQQQAADEFSSLNQQPIYYPPYSSSLFNQFATEEKQIQLAKRIGLIQHLPTGTYDSNGCGGGTDTDTDTDNGTGAGGSTKNLRECVICMVEFSKGDSIRFLPCLHTYHVHCIDDWLMRSFICPSCMEPVDVALLNTL